jgi:zinc transporter 11
MTHTGLNIFQVMTAASYWSLLEPAIDMASVSGLYGEDGRYAFVPVAIGFIVGALFVYFADWLLTKLVSMLQN